MLGFLHHKQDADGASETKAGGIGGDKHHLMIWLTVGVLIVAFLTYKRMGASSSTPTIGYAGNSNTGSTGAGDGIGGQAGYFNQQIAALQEQLNTNDAQHESDLASLTSSFQTALDADNTQDAANESAWNARLQGLTDKWYSISDSIANVGATQQVSSQGNQGLSQALQNQLSAAGERVTDITQSTTGGLLYLTNKGGVYTSDGANYFGSYLGYANSTGNPGAEMAGHGDFNSGHIQALAGGNYEIFNSKGEGYTFNQDTKAKGY